MYLRQIVIFFILQIITYHTARSKKHDPIPIGEVIEPLVERKMKFFTKMSSIAYCQQNLIKTFSCKLCKDPQLLETHSITPFNDSISGAQGFVAVNDHYKTIILSFRGTHNKQNRGLIKKFLKSLLFPQMLFAKGVRVHEGFLETYDSVRETVQTLMQRLARKYPTYRVSMTGHSLGGENELALATLAALDAVRPNGYLSELRDVSSVSIYTLGAPRIGNTKFAKLINKVGFGEVLRAVNHSDPIPHLPPRFVGYHHSSKEIFLTPDKKARYCDDERKIGEDLRCANRIRALLHFVTNLERHGFYFGVGIGEMRAC